MPDELTDPAAASGIPADLMAATRASYEAAKVGPATADEREIGARVVVHRGIATLVAPIGWNRPPMACAGWTSIPVRTAPRARDHRPRSSSRRAGSRSSPGRSADDDPEPPLAPEPGAQP